MAVQTSFLSDLAGNPVDRFPLFAARGLKFQIKNLQGLYDLSGEIKDADLRHCFHIYAKSRFSHKDPHIWTTSDDAVNKVLPSSSASKKTSITEIADCEGHVQTAPLNLIWVCGVCKMK